MEPTKLSFMKNKERILGLHLRSHLEETKSGKDFPSVCRDCGVSFFCSNQSAPKCSRVNCQSPSSFLRVAGSPLPLTFPPLRSAVHLFILVAFLGTVAALCQLALAGPLLTASPAGSKVKPLPQMTDRKPDVDLRCPSIPHPREAEDPKTTS